MRPNILAARNATVPVLVAAVLGWMPACTGGGGGEKDAGDVSAGDVTDIVGIDVPQGIETRDDLPAEDSIRSPYPDRSFVHKMDSASAFGASEKYLADEPVLYRTTDVLPVPDVRVLRKVGSTIVAGTAAGLFAFDEAMDRFEEVVLGEGEPPAIKDISAELDGSGRAAVLTSLGAGMVDAQSLEWTPLAVVDPQSAAAVAVSGSTVYVGGGEGWGVWSLDTSAPDAQFEPLVEESLTVRDLAVDGDGDLWIATDAGVLRWKGGKLDQFHEGNGSFPDDDVRALAAGPGTGQAGAIWAGTASGVSRYDNLSWETLGVGVDLLPAGDVTALAITSKGLVMGHAIGATSVELPLNDGKPFARFDHYTALRWLPAAQVTSVSEGLDAADLFIGTPAGISRIVWVERTLGQGAEYQEKMLEDHFWRMDGFVSSDAGVDDAYAPTKWNVWDKDNDGLWTQMQIGAWCYAYAATGDKQHCVKARKAIENMFLLVDIPAVDFEKAGLGRGFISRSLVREDEGTVYEDKVPQPNWHPVEWKGKKYYWKDDTSSDEITGHMYGFPLYYDLCAETEEEKAEVASYAGAVMSYIVDKGLVLIDLDGEKTFHGHWSPALIGTAAMGIDACMEKAKEAATPQESFAAVELCMESYGGGGWLNATEILGFLLAAWHMTGDTKFYDAYEELVTVHRYDNLVMPHKDTYTITSPSIMNHSDHELAMLAYQTLIRYEPNEDRRKKWIDGLLFLYEWEKPERNPMWGAFVALAAGGDKVEAADALQSMREMPLNMQEWLVDNSHRQDALDWPDDRHGDPQFDRVFRYDELKTVWWNTNFREKKSGGDGRGVNGPMAWLLPYWAFRYSGLLGE
jgi:hypothetical protein